MLLITALVVGAGQAATSVATGLVLDDADLGAVRAIEEELAFFRSHPVYLGGSDLSRLTELPESSARLVESLEAYAKTFGAPRDLEELAAVESVGRLNAEYLQPFIRYSPDDPNGSDDQIEVARQPPVRRPGGDKRGQRPRITLEVGLKRSIELKAGFAKSDGGDEVGFRGGPIAHRSRMEVQTGRHFIARLVTDHDAGEAFAWNPQSRAYGPDFLGGNIQITDVGPVRKLVVGDFTVRLGHGLTVWTGVRRSGSGRSGPANARLLGVSAKTGMSETDYLRGVAVTVGLGKAGTIELFTASMKGIGTSDNGAHRSAREIERRVNSSGTIRGGTITLTLREATLGILASRVSGPHASDDARLLLGLTGSIGAGWARVSGEVTRPNNEPVSWILSANFRPSPWIAVGSQVTRQAKRGLSGPVPPAADPGVSGGADPRWLTTLTMRWRGWRVNAFRDYVVGSWFTTTRWRPPVRVTSGVEVSGRSEMLRARAVLVRDTREQATLIRNGRTVVRGVRTETATRAKMQFNLVVLPSLSQRVTIVYQSVGFGGMGTAVSHELRWVPRPTLILTLGVTAFETPRGIPVYFYEPDVGLQYAWSRLDGGGSRSFVILQIMLGREVDLRAKFGQTMFDGARDVGSGLDHLRTDRLRTVTFSFRVRI